MRNKTETTELIAGDSMIFKTRIAIIIALLVLTGCEFNDAELEAEHYADMVCAAAWPDYKNLEIDCSAREESFEFDERY